MNPHPWLYWLVTSTLIIATSAGTTTLEKPTNIDARRVLLYPASSTTMPDQQFTVTFSLQFNATPIFAMGINQYKMGDRFYIQDFLTSEHGITTTAVFINVTSISSTNPRLFSISYIAVSGESSITTTYHSYTSPTNISSGSNARSFTAYSAASFTSTSVIILPLLTGFYVTSSTFFQIILEAQIVSNFNYLVKVSTQSDCLIQRINLYVLFCDVQTLTSRKYEFQGGQSIMVSTAAEINSPSYTATVGNSTTTVFLMGLRGISGFTILSNAMWGWSLLSTDSNNISTLTIDKNQLQYIYFSFFQIGIYTTTTNPTSPTTPTTPTIEGNSSSLGIIAGLIVGIVILVVIIILIIRYKNKKNEVMKIPASENFREMPSLSL